MKLACLQSLANPCDVAGNLAALERHAAEAAGAGCDLVLTPEMYVTGYNIGHAAIERLAQPRDGDIYRQVAAIARQHGIAIAYGYPERGDTGAVYNSAHLVDREGASLLNYAKTHLFGDVDRVQFQAGPARSASVMLGGWRVGFAICYDIEFPELTRALARDGVDLILAPTANMLPYQSVCTRVVPTRAQENGLFVAYANFTGVEDPFEYCGLSCVCGPDGEDIARALTDPSVLMASLERGALATARAATPYLEQVRPALYRAHGKEDER